MTIGSMFIIPHVARFFVGYDENLLILTTRAFRLYGLSFLIMGFNVYASSFFTALGDGVTSALISFLRTLLFQVAAVLLLPLLLGIDGIWAGRDCRPSWPLCWSASACSSPETSSSITARRNNRKQRKDPRRVLSLFRM